MPEKTAIPERETTHNDTDAGKENKEAEQKQNQGQPEQLRPTFTPFTGMPYSI